jgi:hypothetical protein
LLYFKETFQEIFNQVPNTFESKDSISSKFKETSSPVLNFKSGAISAANDGPPVEKKSRFSVYKMQSQKLYSYFAPLPKKPSPSVKPSEEYVKDSNFTIEIVSPAKIIVENSKDVIPIIKPSDRIVLEEAASATGSMSQKRNLSEGNMSFKFSISIKIPDIENISRLINFTFCLIICL